jgi:hypothetical protein
VSLSKHQSQLVLPSFKSRSSNDGRLSIFIWDSGDIGVECVETSEEQSPHYPFSVVAFKEIMSRLTMFRPRRVATDLKRYYRLH